ncbi:MAG TPA: hypothetical protein VE082_04405 [Desulfobaccales bacterium]|nr:hypothetical protein [Desulfobaccales bacterium]
MLGGKKTGVWELAQGGPRAAAEKLDRALVGGLMLEVILEAGSSSMDPQSQRRLVKTRLKDTLITHLAGRVTLDRFRMLLHQLDRWFPVYYPLITAGPYAARPDPLSPSPAAFPPPSPPPFHEERLQVWFDEAGQALLPQRPHRKLNQEKLCDFLKRTRGGWFRLKDFERYFRVDRKTAWEYLQKLLAARLLRHNRKRSAAVRYGLDSRFLVVRADTLEPAIRQALSGLPEGLAEQVSGWLLGRAGEPFRIEEWHAFLPLSRCRDLITRLRAASILEEVGQVGNRRRLRLAPRWLQD